MEYRIDDEHRMLGAQIGSILEHARTAYVSVTVAMLITVAGLWADFDHKSLLLWAFSLQTIMLIRYFICRSYVGKTLARDVIEKLRRLLTVIVCFNGVSLGSLAWFFPDQWNVYSFIILLPVLVVTAAATNLSAILPIFFSMLVPVVIQIEGVLILAGGEYLLLAVLFGVFFIGIIGVAKETNRNIRRTYQLQFELESLNKQLVIQKDAAEQANASKSRFLAAASHDLRQPLQAMEMFLSGLAADVNNEKKHYLLSRLRKSLDGMQAMFSSLLDMSKFDAGVITPERRDFSINLLFEMLKLKFEDQCNKKGIRLIIRPCPYYLYSDPALVERVLSNYLSNATRYSDDGGVLLAVRKRGKKLRFEVWDTGRGIAEKELGHIFEAFLQLGNPERDRRKGVGLGLSIVEQISQLLEAPVTVRSRPGKGSVFSLEVPVGKAVENTGIEKSAISGGSKLPDDFLVWVIDDDQDIIDALQIQLDIWGCISYGFNTFDQIKSLMQACAVPPDLIIADYRLSGELDGIRVIQSIRQHFELSVPAILITGDTGATRLQEAKKSGLPLLHKPVKTEYLRLKIQQTLDQCSQMDSGS